MSNDLELLEQLRITLAADTVDIDLVAMSGPSEDAFAALHGALLATRHEAERRAERRNAVVLPLRRLSATSLKTRAAALAAAAASLPFGICATAAVANVEPPHPLDKLSTVLGLHTHDENGVQNSTGVADNAVTVQPAPAAEAPAGEEPPAPATEAESPAADVPATTAPATTAPSTTTPPSTTTAPAPSTTTPSTTTPPSTTNPPSTAPSGAAPVSGGGRFSGPAPTAPSTTVPAS